MSRRVLAEDPVQEFRVPCELERRPKAAGQGHRFAVLVSVAAGEVAGLQRVLDAVEPARQLAGDQVVGVAVRGSVALLDADRIGAALDDPQAHGAVVVAPGVVGRAERVRPPAAVRVGRGGGDEGPSPPSAPACRRGSAFRWARGDLPGRRMRSRRSPRASGGYGSRCRDWSANGFDMNVARKPWLRAISLTKERNATTRSAVASASP